MRHRWLRKVLVPGLLVVSALLGAGCIVPGYTEAGITISGPPPGLRFEARIAAPAPSYVWIPGYWDWDGHWGWVAGAWQLPPRPRARWVPPHYRHSHGQWMYYRGHWR